MRRFLLFNPWRVTAFVSLALLVSSCRAVVGSLATPFLYEEVALPNAQIVRVLPYHEGDSSHPDKHRLDLFLPTAGSAGAAADAWPVVVFVHGEGWTSGDRGLRFGDEDWMREASVVARIGHDVPDTLILYAADDWDSLQRQAVVLEEALRSAGGPARRVEVPDENHCTVILALSRREGVAGPSVVEFVSDTHCDAKKRG